MKKVVLVLGISCVVFINSFSQTKQESIKGLFHLMKQDSLIEKTFSSIIPTMMSQLQSQINDSASKVRVNNMMNSILLQTKEISKKMINEDMVLLYEKYFTQAEINDYLAFYKTPSGQKFINVTPDLQKDLMTIMMQKYMPELQKSIKEQTEEIKNLEHKK